MTREEYKALIGKFMLGAATNTEIGDAIVSLYWENEELKGKIHELEETLDGRG